MKLLITLLLATLSINIFADNVFTSMDDKRMICGEIRDVLAWTEKHNEDILFDGTNTDNKPIILTVNKTTATFTMLVLNDKGKLCVLETGIIEAH